MLRPGRDPGPDQGDLRPVRLPGRPGRADRGPARRRAAAGGDHQGAGPRRRGADPRRADRRAHAAGDRRADRASCGQLKADGTSIVFITHKLREVKAVADTITVIRRGKVVGDAPSRSASDDRAGRADGRPGGQPDAEQGTGAAGRSDLHGLRTSRCVATGRRAGRRHLASTSPAARSSRSPACRATARPSSPRPCWACRTRVRAPSGLTAANWWAKRSRTSSTPGVGFVPEDRSDRRPRRHLLRRGEPHPQPVSTEPPFARGLAHEAGR